VLCNRLEENGRLKLEATLTRLAMSAKTSPGISFAEQYIFIAHIGSATIETRTAMGMLALDNVDVVLNDGVRRLSSVPPRATGET
jgi:lactate dehydrogenase-like 2-hydroxyacid dehydrogenase